MWFYTIEMCYLWLCEANAFLSHRLRCRRHFSRSRLCVIKQIGQIPRKCVARCSVRLLACAFVAVLV